MATATSNPIDIDMFSEMQMGGDTEVQSKAVKVDPQSAFIKKCIHPPSAVPGYEGIPTNDSRSQVCLEWRRMNLNNQPYVIDASTSKVVAVTPADLSQFDYAFLHVNGARVMSVPFIYNKSANTLTQDVNNLQYINQYNWANWHLDANLYRVVYKSTTHILNATMFNNTGIVVGNQFNPSLLFTGVTSLFADELPSYFRKWVRDLHRRGLLNVTTDPVEVETYRGFPKSVRDDICDFCGFKPGTSLNLAPDAKIQILNLNQLSTSSVVEEVPSNDSILQGSLRSYGGKAMEGAFTVQRLNTIAPQWCVASNHINSVSTPYPGLYYCYTCFFGADGALHFVPLSENGAVGTAATDLATLQDTMWTTDMTMSWVKFSGLSLNFNAASVDSPSMQLMGIKQYIGLEVQPSPISAWCAMMKLGPKPDLQSMQALMDGFYELKDVLPARYNFWGTLGSIAAQGLRTFGSSILDNLMKGGGSNNNESKSKKTKPKKEASEVREIARKEDSVNKKLDMLLAAFTKTMQVNSGGRRRAPKPKRKPRGRSRAPAKADVLPPGQVNQANPPAPKQSRRKSRRRASVPA